MNLQSSRCRPALAVVIGLMLTVTLYACHPINNLARDETLRQGGVISLISGGGGHAEICHLPVRDLDLGRWSLGCYLTNPKYITFKTVPSATTIRFIGYKDANDCSGSEIAYSIEFKTRGEYSDDANDPWDIQEMLRSAAPGKIMDENFMVNDLVRQPEVNPGYDYIDKLSCIRIRDGHSVTAMPQKNAYAPIPSVPPAPTAVPGTLAEYGSLVLTDINDEVCTLRITGADIRKSSYKTSIPGCGENFIVIRSIQLLNTPSALTIHIGSYGYIYKPGATNPYPPLNDCDLQNPYEHAFRIDMKTTGSIIGTSRKFDIDDIISTTPKNAIVENLRLMSYSRGLNILFYPTAYYFSCFKFDLGGA